MAADEAVDVVDEQDRVVGRATRAVMRARRLRHRAVYVLAFDPEGRLFVHQRTAGKDVYPSFYDVAIGGVVGAGESYDGAARRELAEELGVVGASLACVGELRYEDDANRINGRVYRCVVDGPVRLQAEEIVSGEWLEWKEVERALAAKPFCPDGVQALRRCLEGEAGPERGGRLADA